MAFVLDGNALSQASLFVASIEKFKHARPHQLEQSLIF